MEYHNHGIMMEEAECTFAALDCLQIDYVLFRQRVTTYITQAAALTEINKTISYDFALQELLKSYKTEKLRFNENFHDYCKAGATFLASSEQLSLLRENVSFLRDMLNELEIELSCCDAENITRRDNLLHITKTMSKCEDSVQTASQDVADPENREIELSAVKAAFEKARAQLRM